MMDRRIRISLDLEQATSRPVLVQLGRIKLDSRSKGSSKEPAIKVGPDWDSRDGAAAAE